MPSLDLTLVHRPTKPFHEDSTLRNITLTRRAFLARTSAAARNSVIALSIPMILSGAQLARAAQAINAEFETLNADEAAEFAAIAARIIPTDDSPGATEAGAIYFIDHVLGNERKAELSLVREGLAQLQASAQSTYGTATFHTLTEEQQDSLLSKIEDGPFFGTMRFLTVAGTFSLPEYGGNRDNAGWKIIGFENRHMWMPPYGFYDADYAAKGE